MKKYNQLRLGVLEYLQETFPSPFYLKTKEYEIGTILYTANPYRRTNATIVDIVKSIGTFYVVLTDIGNILELNKNSLVQDYLPPTCKRTSTLPLNMDEYYELPNEITFK